MSGISFSSSASRQAEQALPVSFPFPVTPEVISALAAVDSGLVAGYVKSAFSAYHATLRLSPASSVVSDSSASSVSKKSGVGLSTGKIAKSRHLGARSWRASGVSGKTPGYCYLRAFTEHSRAEAAKKLGKWPSFYQLLSYDRSAYDAMALENLAVSVNGSGRAHIEVGVGEYSLDYVLQDLASRSQPAVVSSSVYHGFVSKGPVAIRSPFSASTLVGEGSLAAWLKDESGVEGGISLPDDVLQLISMSAAMLDEGGKKRLRSLEAVGDSALTATLAIDNYLQGGSAQRFQDLRSHVTNNKVLSQCFCDNLPVDSVSFVGGVRPSVGVVGAKALESILGAIWIHSGARDFSRVVRKLGLVDFELQVAV